MKSKHDKTIIEAYKKGYRVNKKGVVNSPNRKIKLTVLSGYEKFNINYCGKSEIVKVHRFIAYCKFKNKLFKKGIVVRHLDGISTNNYWLNIAIGNTSDNSKDIPEKLRFKFANHAAKYRIKHDAEKIKKDRKKGFSYQQLMIKYNIKSKGTMSYIINSR